MTPAALEYMKLFKRVKRWKALPSDGGILDQSNRIMARLDMIAELVEEHEEREAKLAAQRRENNAALARAGGRGRVISWNRG